MGLFNRADILTKLSDSSNVNDVCVEVAGHGNVCHSDVLNTLSNYVKESTLIMSAVETKNLRSGTSIADLPTAEDDGCCGSANPYVPAPAIATVILVLNVFLPGVGTICAAYYDPNGCNCKTITCGIF